MILGIIIWPMIYTIAIAVVTTAATVIWSKKFMKTYIVDIFYDHLSEFSCIQRYLNANPNCCLAHEAWNHNLTRDGKAIIFTVVTNQAVILDEFEGAEFSWKLVECGMRQFVLTSNRGHSKDIIKRYLEHVLSQGKPPTLEDRGRDPSI